MIATGFEPLSPIWGCSLGYSVLHIVQQIKTVCHAASTPNGYDIFNMCAGSPTQVKQKNPILLFRRIRPFWQKIIVKPVTLCDQVCSCKICSLRLSKQKNERETQQTEHPLCQTPQKMFPASIKHWYMGMRV